MNRDTKRRRPPRLANQSANEDGKENSVDFDHATRRLLFRGAAGDIPGRGTSAAARPVRHVRTKITMNLDGDVVAHFKAEAETAGIPYQTLINQVLRQYVNGSRPEQLAKQVGTILAEDPSFLELLSKHLHGSRRGE